MYLQDCSILPVLEQALQAQQVKNLKVENDVLSLGEPGLLAKLQAAFGYGAYGTRTIAEFLTQNKDTLTAEANAYMLNHKKIAALSDLIEYLCKSGQQPVFDLTAAVLADWMLYLPEHTKQLSIQDMIMPGSYHSTSFQLQLDDPIIQRENNLLPIWSTILNTIPGNMLVRNWELRQNESIYNQLTHGIRFLDLYIAYNTSNKQFYTGGVLTTSKLAETLKEIRSFLDSHPGEIVLLNINPAWEYRHITREHYAEAADLINTCLGDLTVKESNNFKASISELIANNQRVLVLTETPWDRILPEAQQQVINAWHNNSDSLPISQVEEIRNLIKKDDGSIPFNYLHFTTSINPGTVLLHPDLTSASAKFHANLEELLADYNNTHNTYIYGITLDQPSPYDVESIISFNMYEDM